MNIVSLSCDPPEPKAGQTFRLTVHSDQNAPVGGITVSLEKQRVLESAGGAPELRPTGPDYFDPGPKPIKVPANSKRGTSEPISVRKNAVAEAGEPPVQFPEQLLFTAYIDQMSAGFRSTLVLIQPFA